MKWCGFDCEYATAEGTEDATGACRREQVLYCRKFQKFVKRNATCIEILRERRRNDPVYQRLFGKKEEGD